MERRERRYGAPQARNDRGRSPSQSGDGDRSSRERSRSPERGDRAESSYNRGRQEVAQQSESTVQRLWMTEEKPKYDELEDPIREMTIKHIEEVISNHDLTELHKKGLHSLAHTNPEAKNDQVYTNGEADVLSLRTITDHGEFAAKLHSMLQGDGRTPGWASDQAAVEMIGNAIRQKWRIIQQ